MTTLRPGLRNSISDVAGLAVGQAGDLTLATGVTVVLPARPVVASVDVRGGGPGTRETDLLQPEATVDRIDAVVLSGGSAFGLDAAGAVARWLFEQDRGWPVPAGRVPIVPAAILYDLGRGAQDSRAVWPWADMAAAAAESAGEDVATGTVGAGTGARAGALKGGVGTASVTDGTVTVGALAAVNALGSVVMPGLGTPWAWALEMDDEFGGLGPPVAMPDPDPFAYHGAAGTHTTLAVVATDAALTKAQAARLATMAQDGLARAIRPSHLPLDGDTVFALSTLGGPEADLARLGAMAADCLARAVTRGVIEATSLGEFRAWRDIYSQ